MGVSVETDSIMNLNDDDTGEVEMSDYMLDGELSFGSLQGNGTGQRPWTGEELAVFEMGDDGHLGVSETLRAEGSDDMRRVIYAAVSAMTARLLDAGIPGNGSIRVTGPYGERAYLYTFQVTSHMREVIEMRLDR